MRVIFTCGGTGGHINPAIAVAKLLQSRQPDCEILFIGAVGGMEETLVRREGFRLETLKISNFQRRLTPAAIGHNVKTAANIAGAMRRVKKILRKFQPDVIVGTGGYASFPALKQGAKLHIPTAVHESNAVPGLTTRMVADRVDRIMVCFEESKACYANADRVRVVGMPVREEFIYRKRRDARQALGLDERPLVVSCWGSLGAREMNKKIAEFFKLESVRRPVAAYPCHRVLWLALDAGICPAAGRRSDAASEYRHARVYLQYARADGSGGCYHLPGRLVHFERGGGGGYAVHHCAVAQRDGQSPGEKRPHFGKAGRGRGPAGARLRRQDAL